MNTEMKAGQTAVFTSSSGVLLMLLEKLNCDPQNLRDARLILEEKDNAHEKLLEALRIIRRELEYRLGNHESLKPLWKIADQALAKAEPQ